jgi:hypothetical protein
MYNMARIHAAALLMLSGVFAGACANVDGEETDEDSQAITIEGEYNFRHEFPANRLFDKPLTKAFTLDLEKKGTKAHAIIKPTVKVQATNPIVEGKVTVGRRSRIFGRTPKIMSAELKASSTYVANLTVDIDVKWNNTDRADVMKDIVSDFEAQLNDGKALELATRLGETPIVIKDAQGNPRKDLPLKAYYDVAVTCAFDEIDGDVQGTFTAGARGTVIARAIYNSEGVEERRFRRDPTKKFELDTSDFRMDPAPSFRFTGAKERLKASCAVQPSIVVSFDEKGIGASVRVDAESSFETRPKPGAGESVQWEFVAKPKLSIWGETDIMLPIVHRNLNLEKQLWVREFAETKGAVTDTPPAVPPPPGTPTGGCFSNTLQKALAEGACVQSKTDQVWFQCDEGKWFRGGDGASGPFGACTSSHPL